MTYVDGFVVPVPKGKLRAYRSMAQKAGRLWMEHGALEYKECALQDTKDHKFCLTFPKAFRSRKGETAVFAYIVYKSRQHRDQVNKKVMRDPRIQNMCAPADMPFDCARMAYGGFDVIVDARKPKKAAKTKKTAAKKKR